MAAPTESPRSGGSVLAVLHAQHDCIRELLAHVRDARGTRRAEPFDALRRLIAAHETAEELVLRPVSVQIMDRDAATARNHEERRIIGLLAHLEGLDAFDGGDFDRLFPSFERCIAEHLSLEEATEFPVIESEVDAHERLVMGRWMQRALVLGPTRAHPVAAGHPAAQRAAAPFAALADHARDLLERTRGH